MTDSTEALLFLQAHLYHLLLRTTQSMFFNSSILMKADGCLFGSSDLGIQDGIQITFLQLSALWLSAVWRAAQQVPGALPLEAPASLPANPTCSPASAHPLTDAETLASSLLAAAPRPLQPQVSLPLPRLYFYFAKGRSSEPEKLRHLLIIPGMNPLINETRM